MNVFQLRNSLIDDYASYVGSFIRIQDDSISQRVEQEFVGGLLWPDPLIQLNPSFEPGEWVDELVDAGLLGEEARRVFRKGKDADPTGQGKALHLYKHQADAVKAARTGDNYVLTTGTGSGKSLAYIVPIVDFVLRHGSGGGIKAIIVYPMNALANSQHGELEKFLCAGYPDNRGPVTFRRYTGQESKEEKDEIIARPPDILLTNYVMLELILTRPAEHNLISAAQGLQFLVLDELHTYRGRQGADVALLVRRTRDALSAENLQCVGTSATLAGPGTYDEQRKEVARVASLLFGSPVKPENVIGETLKRITPDRDLSDPQFAAGLRDRISDAGNHPSSDFDEFRNDPLSVWIEGTFGITTEKETGRLVRAEPRSITGDQGAAKDLAGLTELGESRCAEAIQETLLASYQCENPDTGFPAFAFRLHQFISRGDTVYATLNDETSRHLTPYRQKTAPDGQSLLFPLVFCRECGQEYYCVRVRHPDAPGMRAFEPRDLNDRLKDEGSVAGFLYHSTSNPWPEEESEIVNRVPDEWTEERNGGMRVRPYHRRNLPEVLRVAASGRESEEGLECQYVSSPFRFCLNCGVAYSPHESSDFAKLGTLGSEGRSTATTILVLSSILHLREEGSLPEEARKLLSFTDNRQDASL